MSEAFSAFDWDEGNRKKCQAHGVSISEIEDMFLNQPGIFPDLTHSSSETRFLATGRMMKKSIPELRTDQEAERYIETADLSQHDLSRFVPTRFEFQAKAAQLNMRLSQSLLDAVKARAKARGILYTRFVRETLEQAVNPRTTGPHQV